MIETIQIWDERKAYQDENLPIVTGNVISTEITPVGDMHIHLSTGYEIEISKDQLDNIVNTYDKLAIKEIK